MESLNLLCVDMNANELAGELETGAKRAEDHATIAIRVIKAATMLRQQQEEIEYWKEMFAKAMKEQEK